MIINLRRWWLGRTVVEVPWSVQAIAVLAVFTLAAIIGYGYLPANVPEAEKLPAGIAELTARTGLGVWAGLWWTAAAACLYGFARRRPRWCIGVAVISGVWGFGYAITALRLCFADQPSRDYLGAALYLFIGVIIALWVFCARPPRSSRDTDHGSR